MALLLLLAACAQQQAQVPRIEELASAWTPVRICRPHTVGQPLQPCYAGGDLPARACGDYGCCALPAHAAATAAAHSTGPTPPPAPACYMPNGGSAGGAGANQSAFGADPWLNDGQAVPSLSQPGALLSIDWGADLLGVECFASPPLVGNCKSPGGGLLLPHGGPSFAQLSVDGVPSAQLATNTTTQWMPHQISRNATLHRPGGEGALHVRTQVRMGFDSQTVLLRLELSRAKDGAMGTATTGAPEAPLNMSVGLAALINYNADTDERAWGWDVERAVSTKGFTAQVGGGGQVSLTSHASGAVSAAAFSDSTTVRPVLSRSTSGSGGGGVITAHWADIPMLGHPETAGASPDYLIVVELVLVVGHGDMGAVSGAAMAIARNFSSAWEAARDGWQSWWASTFDPSVETPLPWEGQLPVLTTADTALHKVYYMNVVSLLGNARHVTQIPRQMNTSWANQTVFATGGPVCAVAEMIIWDTALNAHLLTLLQPSLFASYVERWLGMDIHVHLAMDMVSNTGEQKWYAFDDMMTFRAMETLARFLGPREFAARQLGGKAAWEWMEESATYWQNLTHGCNTPACHGPPYRRQTAAAPIPLAGCDPSGVYYGCHFAVPTAAQCGKPAFDQPLAISALPAADGGHSLRVTAPASYATHGWWSVGVGNVSGSGVVMLDLFMADGKPYASIPALVGRTFENNGSYCAGLIWTNTNTSWCKNGTAAFCTSVPAVSHVDGLADYGSETNLLECVPTYVHKVAALNAANSWMMRSCAVLGTLRGDRRRADELHGLAANVSAAVRHKLYVGASAQGGGGFFAAEQPDGRLTPVRHVIDFISVATSIPQDLSPTQRAEMVGFVKRELLTEHWMRALSLGDVSLLHPSANSDRKDHGPLGAYDGWPGETIEAFAALGDYAAALRLVRSMAAAYHDGPGGQAHQVFTNRGGKTLQPVAKAAADQQWYELAGSVTANRVISALFGVRPPLDDELPPAGRLDDDDDKAAAAAAAAPAPAPGSSFLRDAATPRGFDGTLSGLRIRGKLWSVHSTSAGLSIEETTAH